jgi:hypothetical protein
VALQGRKERKVLMRKALLIVAMLLSVVPVMAATTITAVQEGEFVADGMKQRTVRIDYSTDVNVRAFALDINIDAGPTFDSIRDFKTGESTAASPGYGIFPSRFREYIVVTGPNWVDSNYNPTTYYNEPGAVDTGMGWPRMIVEMGTLYAGDVNKPALSGTLFRFDVNSEGGSGTFNLSIAADALRGGVVGVDGNTIAATFVGTAIVFTPACTDILDEVGQAKATAETAWTGQGFSLNGTAVVDCTNVGLIRTQDTGCVTLPYTINYTYGIAPAEPNVAGMSRSAAVSTLTDLGFVIGADVNVAPTTTYTTVRTVTTQNPVAGTTGCGTTVNLSVVSYPVKDAALNSLYANWVNRGRPACWAYPRQCRGGADGKKQLNVYWVGSNNLAVLKAGFNKTEATFNSGSTVNGTSLICASADHKKQLNVYWVGSNNLAILKAYFNKTEAGVPLCGNVPPTGSVDPNYWYWCVPTGAVCPTGQYCAPVAVCPNTP